MADTGPGPLNPWRVVMGRVELTATEETAAIAHGLPATPTFVLAHQEDGGRVDFTADATTLTLSQISAAASNISYIAAVE